MKVKCEVSGLSPPADEFDKIVVFPCLHKKRGNKILKSAGLSESSKAGITCWDKNGRHYTESVSIVLSKNSGIHYRIEEFDDCILIHYSWEIQGGL